MSDQETAALAADDLEPFDADELEIDLDASDANEADAAEQHRTADAADQPTYRHSLPDDVDPADAADQYREVALDEDDYR